MRSLCRSWSGQTKSRQEPEEILVRLPVPPTKRAALRAALFSYFSYLAVYDKHGSRRELGQSVSIAVVCNSLIPDHAAEVRCD